MKLKGIVSSICHTWNVSLISRVEQSNLVMKKKIFVSLELICRLF